MFIILFLLAPGFFISISSFFLLQAKGANRKLKLEKEKIESLSKESAVSILFQQTLLSDYLLS